MLIAKVTIEAEAAREGGEIGIGGRLTAKVEVNAEVEGIWVGTGGAEASLEGPGGAGVSLEGAGVSLEGPGGAEGPEACLEELRGTGGIGLIANVDIKAEAGAGVEVERAGGAGYTAKVEVEVEAEGRAGAEGAKECLEGAEGAEGPTLIAKVDIKAEGGGGAWARGVGGATLIEKEDIEVEAG